MFTHGIVTGAIPLQSAESLFAREVPRQKEIFGLVFASIAAQVTSVPGATIRNSIGTTGIPRNAEIMAVTTASGVAGVVKFFTST
jgi:hypothetical protein